MTSDSDGSYIGCTYEECVNYVIGTDRWDASAKARGYGWRHVDQYAMVCYSCRIDKEGFRDDNV